VEENLRGRSWRQWCPQLVSERDPDKQNTIRTVDCMGIAAVSIEAKVTPSWPSSLTSSDATRAAQYATLELNGFPAWFGALVMAWPREVADVLMVEVRSQISAGESQPIPRASCFLVYAYPAFLMYAAHSLGLYWVRISPQASETVS
jgi:hypothetical protein